jgi:polyphosphate kinase
VSSASRTVESPESVLEKAARDSVAGAVNLRSGALLNMELSTLAFNERVLELTVDPRVPVLERVRFLSILGGNLDEFFMTRVAGFKHQVALGTDKQTLDGLTPQEQLRLINERARSLLNKAYREVLPGLSSELSKHGSLLNWNELEKEEVEYVERNYVGGFDTAVSQVAFVPGAPFPHVRNLRPAFLVSLEPGGADHRYCIVEMPGDVPRLIPLPGGRRFIPLEDVVRQSLPRLVDRGTVGESYLFRVTRSANLSLEREDIEDLVEVVAETVARRPFQPVVRVEVEEGMPTALREKILAALRIEASTRSSHLAEEDVYAIPGLIDLRRLEEIAALPIPEMRYPRIKRRSPLRERPSSFTQIARGDVFVSFPWTSFEKTVERFLGEATNDPHVEAIRVTLYRTNRTSRIVKLLRRAHRNGKKVVALIEVKASFDERRNIEWARALEAAGIRVLYGPPSIKVHAKIASVSRREDGELRDYSYVGTGNLNAATAAAYTDLGIFTADPQIGRELTELFETMGGGGVAPRFERLMVAPFNMRARFLELIDREVDHARAGRGGAMTVKLNGIADRGMIAALYEASQAGVRIDLDVRGICALRPGVPGLSDNIRVVANAGRFLEHSRIYRFDNAGAPEHYIGSADWRGRNLSRRVEVVIRVTTPAHCQKLDEILAHDLESPDAWDMRGDGSYVRRSSDHGAAQAAVSVGQGTQ